jgi:flagellar basal-body rod modification protein FlgD
MRGALMSVASTTAVTGTQSTQTSQTTASQQATLDYNSFLKLLIAQMQNQDPTDPADPAEWMGQIASFSNVEQAIQTNAKLDSLMTSMALSQVDGLLGHTVTSGDGDVSGKVAAVRIVSGGTVAILEDGTELLMGEGVEVT